MMIDLLRIVDFVKHKLRVINRSLYGHVITNAGWTMAATPFIMVLGVIQTGLIARMLGVEGVGILAVFVAITAFLTGLSNDSSAETLLTFVSRSMGIGDKNEASRIVVYCHLFDLTASSIAYGVLLLFTSEVCDLFHVPQEHRSLLDIYGLIIIFSATYLDSHSLLRVANRFQWTFYQKVISASIKTAVMVGLFWQGGTLKTVVLLYIFMAFLDSISTAILGLIAFNSMGVGFKTLYRSGFTVSEEIKRFQWMGYGRSFVKSLNRYVDILLIGYLASPTEVGFYRISKQLADLLKTPAQGFISSLYPEYSRLWFSKQIQPLRKLTLRFTLAFIVLGLGLTTFLFFYLDQIIILVLGVAFLPARRAALILLISALLVLIMTPIYSLPAATGQGRPALQAVIVALLVQIVLMWLLIPSLGAVGAAWANVAYVIIWIVLLLPSIGRVLRYKPEKYISDSERNVAP